MTRRDKNKAPPVFKHQPFKKLKEAIKDIGDLAPVPSTPAPVSAPLVSPKLDDDALLAEAMADVTPIADVPARVSRPSRPRPMLMEADEDELALRELDELVHGVGAFDFADTDEFIEASVVGLDKRILKKLRRGEFSCQAHLDLHGLNRIEARTKVGEFIRKCALLSFKCVLIVHGRGLGSKDNIPIIKNKLAAWLTRGAIGKRVLAYTSARSYDGGAGAVYVLLRTG